MVVEESVMPIRRFLAAGSTPLATLALVAGCALLPLECSAAGCENVVVFSLADDLRNGITYQVEACVDDRCTTATMEVPDQDGEDGPHTGQQQGDITLRTDLDEITLQLPDGDYGGTRQLSLTIMADGHDLVAATAVVEFVRDSPNGANCPPHCWRADLSV